MTTPKSSRVNAGSKQIRGDPVSKNNFFPPFGPPFGLKLRGGGGEVPGPSPRSATEGKEGLCCQCEDNRTGYLKLGFSKNFLTREHYELFKKRFRISLTVRHLAFVVED